MLNVVVMQALNAEERVRTHGTTAKPLTQNESAEIAMTSNNLER